MLEEAGLGQFPHVMDRSSSYIIVLTHFFFSFSSLSIILLHVLQPTGPGASASKLSPITPSPACRLVFLVPEYKSGTVKSAPRRVTRRVQSISLQKKPIRPKLDDHAAFQTQRTCQTGLTQQ